MKMPALTTATSTKVLFFSLCCSAGQLVHAATIVPEFPHAFERVNLRVTVDSCAFDHERVQVDLSAERIRVILNSNPCLVAGPLETVDIQVGAFPSGVYRVDVFLAPDLDHPVSLSFTVPTIELVAGVVPVDGWPYVHPLTDYTAVWWTPTEGGTGLALQQSASPRADLFGVWAVYGSDHQPTWYSLQAGHWTNSTTWTGSVVKTTGPYWAAAVYDPTIVGGAIVGTATLDFHQVPGSEGTAKFIYTIDGTSASKAIVRMGF